MADYGLKVSNVGQDAGTTADKDLQFTTKYSTLKLYQTGSVSVAKTGTASASGSAVHNLGFEPAFYTFRKFTASNSFMDSGTTYPNSYIPLGGPSAWTGDDHQFIHAYSDTANINFFVDSSLAVGTYDFKYYLLVDLANDFSGADPSITDQDYGFKVSKPGISVKTAKEYELAYSSKYRALQYYDVNIASAAATLPIQAASKFDNPVEAGTYVDFYHGLGYAPLYMAFFRSDQLSDPNLLVESPFGDEGANTEYIVKYDSFANSNFVRFSFYREVFETGGTFGTLGEEIMNMKMYVFTENLTGTAL
jgi:hypothetical protein